MLAHVLLTVPDVVMVSNSLSVLTCTIYPLIHDHESIAGFHVNLPVFTNVQSIGESNVGVVGGIISITKFHVSLRV